MRTKTFLISIILIVLLSSIAAAQDFMVAGSGDVVKTCQCSPYIDSIVVRNTGLFTSKFSISTDLEFAVVQNNLIELEPGKQKEVRIILQSPCEIKDYDYTITVNSILGGERVLERKVEVERCQNLKASSEMEFEAIDPCNQNSFTIYVENIGDFPENYLIELDGDLSEFFEHEAYQLTLIPGQTGLIETTLTPTCEVYGDFEIPITITALKNKLEARILHSLTINRAYNFSQSVPEDLMACQLVEARIPLEINNDAAIPNNYTISVSGADFLSVEESEIFIDTLSSKTVDILAVPTEKDEGLYNVTVTTTSQYGDMVNELTFPLEARNCFGLSVNIDLADNPRVCSGEHFYDVIVKNNGFFEEEIRMEVEGVDFVSFSEDLFELDPGEEKIITLTLFAPEVQMETYEFDIRAIITKNDLSYGDSLRVVVADIWNCHEFFLPEKKFKVIYGQESLPIIVKNNGFERAEYILEYEGSAWFALEDFIITLDPGEERTINLLTYQADEPIYPYYGSTLRAVLVDTGVTYEHQLDIRVGHRSIFIRFYDYVVQDACRIVTTILVLAIIALALIAIIRTAMNSGRRTYKPKNLNWLAILLMIVFALVLIISYAVYGLPKPVYDPLPVGDELELEFVMAEDSTYTLNMSRYFIDYDDDPLTYSVSEIDNVQTFVEGDLVTFVPENDWFGTRRFRITATDTYDDMTESDRMLLRVIDRQEYNIFRVYHRYCNSFNLILLLIAFLLFYLVMVLPRRVRRVPRVIKAPKPPKKKRGRPKKR
jgi:uncharacterized membrane protein